MTEQERVRRMDEALSRIYPETPALAYSSPFTLLVAAILAAQCTDERVNRVTATLFGRYPDPATLAAAPLDELEEAVHSTGFFRQKARTLQACCRELAVRFGGAVPASREGLTSLPGVGRKTANLVLGNSLGVPGIFVDTHVKRIAFRLGLTRSTNPDRIEEDLAALVPPARQAAFSNLLTHLGRSACSARSPRCTGCPVENLCPKLGVG